jgi:hypothetical protein
MPTFFNGWEIIPLPAYPAAPASVEFTAMDTVAVSTNPFTAQQQVQDWQASWLEASVIYPPLTHAQAQCWIAFLMSLRGQTKIFQMGDPLAGAARGSPAGVPLVNGSSQTGYSLATKGWSPGASGVLLAGDLIQIGYRLYRNLTNANADGGGLATLSIWPQIRESPSDGTSIITAGTKALWRLKTNSRKWSLTEMRVYGLQFDIREAL